MHKHQQKLEINEFIVNMTNQQLMQPSAIRFIKDTDSYIICLKQNEFKLE